MVLTILIIYALPGLVLTAIGAYVCPKPVIAALREERAKHPSRTPDWVFFVLVIVISAIMWPLYVLRYAQNS